MFSGNRSSGFSKHAIFGIIGLSAFTFGCKGTTGSSAKPTNTAAQADTGPSRCDTNGKRIVKIDLNQDKQPDVWKLYAKQKIDHTEVDVLTCKERDLNFDGRKDTWYHYDNEGNLALEEMDVDFDGQIDLTTFRRGGKVIRKEMDTDHNNRVDVWQQFEDAVLVRVERDTDGDGRVDYWEHYEGGRIDRIGYDNNGDGRVDRWDRAATAPEEPANASGQS